MNQQMYTKTIVKGFVNYNPDYTENLYYEKDGEVFGRFNIKTPNHSFGKLTDFVKCEKPQEWEFIGYYK